MCRDLDRRSTGRALSEMVKNNGSPPPAGHSPDAAQVVRTHGTVAKIPQVAARSFLLAFGAIQPTVIDAVDGLKYARSMHLCKLKIATPQ